MKHGILSFFPPVSLDDTKELNSPCAATALAGSKLRHAPSTLHFILYLYLFPSRAKETPPQNHYLIPYATKDAASLLHRMLIPLSFLLPPSVCRATKKKNIHKTMRRASTILLAFQPAGTRHFFFFFFCKWKINSNHQAYTGRINSKWN